MDKLIETGVWPLAVVIIALAALLMLRVPLSRLLDRTRKIGAGDNAIDFSESRTELQQIQAQPSVNVGQVPPYAIGPPTSAVAEIEKQIIQTLSTYNETDDTKRQRLIRGFAIMALNHEFETIYRLIFGSQLDLLLRANAGGLDEAGADAIYQNAKSSFPTVHDSGSREMWLKFLSDRQLIDRKDGRISTNPKGKEFMQYLVEAGLTLPKGG
jgi:hypothetical protein